MCARSQLVYSDPLDYETQQLMEFHLVYAGNLLKSSRSGKTWEKHQIRRYFHPQLKKLWETHPLLQFYTEPQHSDRRGKQIVIEHHTDTQLGTLAQKFEGYIPLVMKDFGMVCELDILFLRAEPAGNVLQRGGAGGGDIDNRIKTLFDALCLPLRGQAAKPRLGDEPDPTPLYVLLEDDSLITSVKITADRFLAAVDDAAPDDPASACLVLSVNVKAANPTLLPYQVNL
jgi:hypothetical protein